MQNYNEKVGLKIASAVWMGASLSYFTDNNTWIGFPILSVLTMLYITGTTVGDNKIHFFLKGLLQNLSLFMLYFTWFLFHHYANIDSVKFDTYFMPTYEPTLFTDALLEIFNRDVLICDIVTIVIIMQLLFLKVDDRNKSTWRDDNI